MPLQWYGAILLGSLAFCVYMIVLQPERNVTKPVGPMMCWRLCNQMVRCSSYMYKTRELSCRLHDTSDYKNDNEGWIFVKDNVNKELKNCPKNAKIFFSKRNTLLCRLRWQKQLERRAMRRILILPNNRIKGKVLCPQNNSVHDYPDLMGPFMAAAYIAIDNKLVLSTGVMRNHPAELFFYFLDDMTKINIPSKKNVRGISVDEIKGLVFLTLTSLHTYVSVMTTDGTCFKSVLKLRKAPSDIAADSRRSMFYVTFWRLKIVKYSYRGAFQMEVKIRKVQAPLWLDSLKDDLY